MSARYRNKKVACRDYIGLGHGNRLRDTLFAKQISQRANIPFTRSAKVLAIK